MSDPFLRTAQALDESERHLRDTGSEGSLVESYLTQHVVVLLCADMQQALYLLTRNLASKVGDGRVAEFLERAPHKLLRSVSKSEIAGYLGHFGVDAKETFNAALAEQDVSVYGNAVSDRHDVAHRGGTTITFREAKMALDAARRILDSATHALS